MENNMDKNEELPYVINEINRESLSLIEEKTDEEINAQEDMTFTVNPTPADAKVTLNDEEKKTIVVSPGSPVIWTVEKEGYIKQSGCQTINYDGIKLDVELVAEENSIDPEPEKKLPVVTSTLPQTIETNKEIEFSVSTTPGDYEGTMIYFQMEISNYQNLEIKYYEPNGTPGWYDLPVSEGKFIFGTTSTGFPLISTSANFKITAKQSGEYTVKTEVIVVEDKSVLLTDTQTVTATDAVEASVLKTLIEENTSKAKAKVKTK